MKTTLLSMSFIALTLSSYGEDSAKAYSIDAAFIASAEPDDLAHKAFNIVFNDLRGKTKDMDVAALQLPQHWRAAYCIFLLQIQHNDGGFQSFFDNTPERLHVATEESLKVVGAAPFLPLYQKAHTIYHATEADVEKLEKQLKPVEDDFYVASKKKRVAGYLGDYIKAHAEIFSK